MMLFQLILLMHDQQTGRKYTACIVLTSMLKLVYILCVCVLHTLVSINTE